jgi:cytochrome bd ubiquinol oxidase subunit II
VALADVPLAFVLLGLVFYVVLGGADFGAGFWQLTAGRGGRGRSVRDFAHHAMGPVWEANHVWLVFVLTVTWTAYPSVFASIASTLAAPLFVAAVGIIFRGTTYALRSGTRAVAEQRIVDTLFSLASILTPFALGTAVGAIAQGRVPAGNAAGDELTSWLNPASLLIGALAVATSAYMAAVFLAADTTRRGHPELEPEFRRRALSAGVLAGALAIAVLPVLDSQAHRLFERLVEGRGLPALAVSVAAGLGTLGFVWRRRYEPARYSAAIAVGAIVAGWGLAQAPTLIRGLTITQAAAGRDTLVTLIVAILAGGAIVFPALAVLFRLVLAAQFDRPETLEAAAPPIAGVTARLRSGLLVRVALACLVVGFGLVTIADSGWAHAVGVTALLAFVALAFPNTVCVD